MRAPDRGFAMPPNLLPKEPDLDPYRPLKLSPLPQSVRPMDATADPVMGFAAPESRKAPPPWLTGATRGDRTPDEIRAATAPVKPAGKGLLSAVGFGPEARMDLLKSLAGLDKKDAAGRADRGRDKVLDAAAAKFEVTASVLGGAFGSVKLAAADAKTKLYKLKVPEQIIPRLRELADGLNKDSTPKLSPLDDLGKHLGDIGSMAQTSSLVIDPNKAFDAFTGAAGGAFAGIAEAAAVAKGDAEKAAGPKLITPDVRALATMSAYKNATTGLDLTYRPPPTAEYGSREFAKLEASVFAGSRNDSVPDTLKAMRKLAEDQLSEARKLTRDLARELEWVMGPPINMPSS